MKVRYKIYILIILIIFIFLSWIIISSPTTKFPWLGDFIQAAAVFVALIASIIALATSDPALKVVKIDIETLIAGKKAYYSKTDLPNNIINQFIDLPDKLSSQQIHFTMKNNSGFTLNNPTITFRLPNNCQHPQKDDGEWTTRNNSNLFNSQKELKKLEFGDTTIISNNNLPYWNDGETITIWIRMLLERIQMTPFEVTISINCPNAQGCTKKVKISPKLTVINE